MYHKSQVFFYLLSAFIGGGLLAPLFNFFQTFILVTFVVVVGVVMLAGENKLALLVVAMIVFLIVGAVRFNQFDLSKNSLEKLVGQKVVLTGYIDREPETKESIQRFVLKTGKERVLVTASSYPKREFGDFIEVQGKLELPQNFSEDFDYITYLKKDGIKLILFFPEIEKFEKAINLSIPEPNASFINGILLGSRQNIPDDLKEAFNKTGTTHVLAISGYNIMIISEAILLGLIWFFRRRTAFWLSVVIIVLFVILTGASASVVRAAVMGLLLLFAHGYGRLYDQKNSIILAGAVMIYHNPSVLVFDIGFQLSFSAVLGLIYIYPRLDHKLYKIPQIGGLKELILMTISAQVAVAPPLIYYFGNFSIVSFPTNILILPFVPAAMLTGFVAGLAGMVNQSFGQVIGYIAWAITMYQIQIVEFFSF